MAQLYSVVFVILPFPNKKNPYVSYLFIPVLIFNMPFPLLITKHRTEYAIFKCFSWKQNSLERQMNTLHPCELFLYIIYAEESKHVK